MQCSPVKSCGSWKPLVWFWKDNHGYVHMHSVTLFFCPAIDIFSLSLSEEQANDMSELLIKVSCVYLKSIVCLIQIRHSKVVSLK